MAQPPVGRRRRRLTFRRLFGLDRSGGPPPETLPGAPLRPWTIPNAIGYLRIGCLIAFLVVALRDDDGEGWLQFALFAVVAWGDYADGIAARLTGQYSRLGALMDPVIDRSLVICGVVVAYDFELLPRWALLILAGREALMLVIGPFYVRRRGELKITMLGRWAVWPTMGAIALSLVGADPVDEILLYAGLALTLAATAQYVRQASTSA